jgi:CHAT domain
VVTTPADEKLLNPWAEIQAVKEAMVLPGYQVEILDRATMGSLREALARSPHILHYIGHAGINHGEGNIILHDQQDGTSWVSAAMLAEILPPTVRLVCLSTCVTAPNYQIKGLPRLSHAGSSTKLPTMVVNQHPLKEESVRIFWEAFYDTLLQSSGNVNEAVHKARSAVFNINAGLSDWSSFVMVIRDRTGQGMRLVSPFYSISPSDPNALELQAQFASQVANDLAEQTRLMGKDAPEALKQLFKREAKRADTLVKKIM